jgi:hypothetical protein
MLLQSASPSPSSLNKIFENVRDPSWWFTAFIVAALASLFAAYIKDILGRFFSLTSSRARHVWQRRRFRVVNMAYETVNDARLLSVAIYRFTLYAIFCTVSVIVMCCYFIVSELRHDNTAFFAIFFSAAPCLLLYFTGREMAFMELIVRVYAASKKRARERKRKTLGKEKGDAV